MKSYVGVDLSKRSIAAVRLVDGKVEQRDTGAITKKELEKFALWLRDEDTVAIETGSNAIYFIDTIRSFTSAKIIVLDPRRLVMIYKSLKKNDQEDALKIARLISVFKEEELPTVYVPEKQE